MSSCRPLTGKEFMRVIPFVLLVGVAVLSLLVVITLYVVWSRLVGLDPTVAREFTALSGLRRTLLALVSGAVLGGGALIAPSVPVGIAAIVMLAASTFAALMAFELVNGRQRTDG
ncbi:hypothetical protein [Halomicrococcus sp. NG-SE-24]|uniref:hypothetical protein n=1 Tax=Halomicrococcus sp. NG-SE-24 TaxID=3436928 RepID=UPI003D995CDF